MTVAASAMADLPVAISTSRASARASAVAWLGVCLWIAVAPFEGSRPLVHLPGQSVSSVEAALLVVLAAWGTLVLAGASATGSWRRLLHVVQTPLTSGWLAFLAAMFVAAVLARAERANAVHMAGRFGLAFAVFLVTVDGITTRARLETILVVSSMVGAVVAVIAALEFAGVPAVLHALTSFRAGIAVVGSQVRAAGPFQYPTIASMYLEILFALTLGLVLLAIDAGRRARAAAAIVALALMAEAVILTFTRSGLITIALSLALVGVQRWRAHRFDAGVKTIAALACVLAVELMASRSLEAVRLRMTTETQDAWYHASLDAPLRLSLQTGATTTVPVTLNNTGLITWDSRDEHPYRLSYHWLLPDADRSIDYEGLRTDFPERIPPGATVTLAALVRAPSQPGEYRLMWDVVQEGRLWFSSEDDAEVTMTAASVSGPAVRPTGVVRTVSLSKGPSRPGRLTLWAAARRMWLDHPIVGVGPDNFRLLYGRYSALVHADPRVHSNNMYIEILTGGGLVALLAFAWLAWGAARVLRRILVRATPDAMSPVSAAVAAACLAIAVHGFVDSFLSFTATYVLFAVTVGLAVACDRITFAHAHRV